MQSGFTCIRYADVGTSLPAIATAPVSWPSSPGNAENEDQSVTITDATGGTFTLTFDGETTNAIAYDASAAKVEEELEDLSSIGEGNVDVTGNDGGPYSVLFINALGYTDVDMMTADDTNLTGTEPTIVVAEDTKGAAGGGVWTLVPNIDPEKDVVFTPGSTIRSLYSPGGARPSKTHIIRAGFEEIKLVSTESAMAALEFMFPAFVKTDHKLALSAVSKETPYIALALELPEGVFEFKKVAPNYETEMALVFNDITQPEFALITHENDSGEVGYFHEFYS